MSGRTMADAVREVLVKRAFVPGDPSMAGGGAMPPGGDPSMAGGMPVDPSMAGGMPVDPSMAGGMPVDPSMAGWMPVDPSMAGGIPQDPMGGVAVDPAAAAAGGMPNTGMINMTADEFTKFIKQMMQAFQGSAAPQQQTQTDIGAKLDTLIAVLQGQAKASAPAVVPA